MIVTGDKIIATGGRVLKRRGTSDYYGTEVTLGYSYYIGGVLQDPPHLDTPEDFEEVYSIDPIPAEEALNIITGM